MGRGDCRRVGGRCARRRCSRRVEELSGDHPELRGASRPPALLHEISCQQRTGWRQSKLWHRFARAILSAKLGVSLPHWEESVWLLRRLVRLHSPSVLSPLEALVCASSQALAVDARRPRDPISCSSIRRSGGLCRRGPRTVGRAAAPWVCTVRARRRPSGSSRTLPCHRAAGASGQWRGAAEVHRLASACEARSK